ncbi:MAG: DinB family protein [Bryobacteraceae bacterium]
MALIQANTGWLRQALSLLARIGDDVYSSVPGSLAPHRAGAHLRHILDFYECFLDGLDSAHIDYDARKRDESIATSRVDAAAKIRDLIARLESAPLLRGDALVWVRLEAADAELIPDPYMTSSVARELQSLSSHTVHHFALIAMTLNAHGVEVDSDFGVAPSTLRYQAAQRDQAAASNRKTKAA